jgi:hypothetical protein
MLTTIRYLLLTALRDYLFAGLLLGVVVATALSAILGSTALLEQEAMTLSFASSAARIMLMMGLMVFVSFHIRQSFEQKEMDVLLSRPLSRFQILFAHWLGFSTIAFLLVLAAATIISLLPHWNVLGFICWAISLLLESWLVVALALFCAFTLRSAISAVLACFGFYVLGRMMGFFLMVVDTKLALGNLLITQIIKGTIAGIALIIPRLDLFGQSDWLVYGVLQPQAIQLAVMQALIAIPLLLAAAMIDFMRREF